PEAVLDAVGELHDLLGRLERHLNVGAVVAVHGRGRVGRVADLGDDDGQVGDGDLVLLVGPEGALRPDGVDGQVVGVLPGRVGQSVLDVRVVGGHRGAAAAASRPPSRASATARVTTRAAAPTIAPTCRFPLVFLTVFLLEPVSRLVLLASRPEATTAKLGPRYPGYGGALV